MSRKTVIALAVVLELLVFGAVLTRVVESWHRGGWTGLAYAAGQRPDGTRPLAEGPFAALPGSVMAVAPGSPAAHAGLHRGDIVEAVDGVASGDTRALELLDATRQRGDTVSYRLRRDQRQLSLDVPLESPFRSWQFAAGFATTVGVAAAFLAISLLVAWSRPASRSALVFFAMCSTGAAAYVLYAALENRFPDTRGVAPTGVDPWVMGILMLALLLSVGLSNLILHLALVFPRERPVVHRRPQLLAWLHTLPFLPVVTIPLWLGLTAATRRPWSGAAVELGSAVLLATAAVRLTRRVRRLGPLDGLLSATPTALTALILASAHALLLVYLIPERYESLVGLVFGIATSAWFVGTMVVYGVLTCVVLVRSYRESGAEERHQVRWPLWGTGTAIVASLAVTVVSVALISLHPSGLGLTVGSALGVFNKLVYLLIPLSFAFAILKYRLLEIDILIRRTFVYGAMTTVVVATYLGVVGLGGLTVVRLAGIESQGVAVVATLLVAALLVPARARLQDWSERWLLRHERDLESALDDLRAALATTRTPAGAVSAVAEGTQRALAVRSVAVLVADGGVLRPAATIGLADRTSRTLRTHIAAATADAEPTLAAAGLVLVAAAPGTPPPVLLAVGPRLVRRPFEAEDRTFLAAAADSLARVLERLSSRRTEAELGQAGEIQRALLPASLPQLPGLELAGRWRPAREMSGDAYDAIRLDEHSVLLTIADVVGKGLPAALLMSSVQTAVRSLASPGLSPRALVGRVREVVTANLTGGRFVTLCAVVLDRRSATVRWCNAGHVPPLLLRRDGRLERLETGGPAIARIFRGLGYADGELSLAAGDALLMCTDGATEAADAGGELLGDERLEAIARDGRGLDAAGLLDHVEAAVLDWASGHLDDDLTLVAATAAS